MRVFILTAFAAVAALAQDARQHGEHRWSRSYKHTPTADAPVFGTAGLFQTGLEHAFAEGRAAIAGSA